MLERPGIKEAMLMAVLVLVGCGTEADHTEAPVNELTAEETAAGWRLLFDGKTMGGWEDPSKETPPGDSWTIEAGCLKSVPKPRIREDLFTLDSFGDFELVFEWRISPKGNSGVKYRVQDRAVLEKGKLSPNAKRFEDTVDYELQNRLSARDKIAPDGEAEEYVVAFEYQLIDNEGHGDALRGANRTAGAIYGLVAPVVQTARPVGEFNESRIVLRGNHVEHWLNGVKVVDTDLDVPEIVEGLKARWTENSPVYQLLTQQPKKRTPIALQHHNDEAWFRNIKIKEL